MNIPSRRRFLAGSAGLVTAATATAAVVERRHEPAPEAQGALSVVPFYGQHQPGIATPQQAHLYFAVFDVTTADRGTLRDLLARWTAAAARLQAGLQADPRDSAETDGMPPDGLTLTFGFGPTLFARDGHDRFGLTARRPEALADLPVFPGDQLQAARSGGDLCIQACAGNPQVAFHAVRQLARLAYSEAEIRWVQAGYLPSLVGQTPRNLMGFRDGTNNIAGGDAAAMARYVWAGAEGPGWMRDGTYLVARRIRIALEHWDRTPAAFQEQTVGRRKTSGAPMGGHAEHDAPNLAANDADGNPLIAENAHVRLASESVSGTRVLRRGYAYNDGTNLTVERWPPWHQGMEYDAGLMFLAFQQDPRSGFVKMFERMAKFDMMNQFTTHVGSAVFACPPGASPGAPIGAGLFA